MNLKTYKEVFDKLIEGILSQEEAMKKEGVWREDLTFEEIAGYAGRRVEVHEQKEVKK
jgi:hypothetical protein